MESLKRARPDRVRPTDEVTADMTSGEAGEAATVEPLGTVSVLPAAAAPARRGRALVATGAAAAGVVLVAAGAWAVQGLVGGGSRADEHLPGTAAAAVLVDLDPSAGQKLGAVQFAHKFPATGLLDWDSADNDPRKWVYEQLTRSSSDAPAWSEVQAWLGKRAGLAELPPSGADPKPVTVVAVQVTDAARAKATLTRASGTFVAVDGDWVIVSDTQAHADSALAAATSSPLSAATTFRADMQSLGEAGIVALWADGSRTAALLPHLPSAVGGPAGLVTGGLSPASLPTGHGAVTLRFDGATLELAGSVHGLGATARPATGQAAVLAPADAAAVVSVAGLGDLVAKNWPQTLKAAGDQGSEAITRIEAQTGLRLPQDLTTLLGTQFTLALRPQDGQPNPAVRAVTDKDPSEALTRLVTALSSSQQAPPLVTRRTADGYVLALTDPAATAMTTAGGLSAAPEFVAAVPKAGQASAIAYLDVARLVEAFGAGLSADDRAMVAPLAALGLSGTADGTDGSSFTVRLTTR